MFWYPVAGLWAPLPSSSPGLLTLTQSDMLPTGACSMQLIALRIAHRDALGSMLEESQICLAVLWVTLIFFLAGPQYFWKFAERTSRGWRCDLHWSKQWSCEGNVLLGTKHYAWFVCHRKLRVLEEGGHCLVPCHGKGRVVPLRIIKFLFLIFIL